METGLASPQNIFWTGVDSIQLARDRKANHRPAQMVRQDRRKMSGLTSFEELCEMSALAPKRVERVLRYIEAGASVGLGNFEWETIKACLRFALRAIPPTGISK